MLIFSIFVKQALSQLPSKQISIQLVDVAVIVLSFIYLASEGFGFLWNEVIRNSIGLSIAYFLMHNVWYQLDIHKRYGHWKTSEPKICRDFAFQTLWILPLYLIGAHVTLKFFNARVTAVIFETTFRFTKEQLGPFSFLMAPENPSLIQNIGVFLLAFYTSDFGKYWAHRWGHDYKILYRTFPLIHAHHHNQVFTNPMTNYVSPFIHLALIAAIVPNLIILYFGWQRAVNWSWTLITFTALTQHMGFDPLPWLTKINHKYFFGALPWITLHHAYHHLHIVKSGNYGNTTFLFDYVFNTVTPELVYHIEHGEPMPKVKRFFANPNLDREFEKLYIGGRKNRLDMN